LSFLEFELHTARRVRTQYGFVGVKKNAEFLRWVGGRMGRYSRWLLRGRLGGSVPAPSEARCTVILLAFKRPANLDPILRSVLKCDAVEKVIVHNNAEAALAPWITVRDPRIVLLEQPKPVPHGIRLALALGGEGRYFLSIDDDVFLYPEQIAALFAALVRDPGVPHGLDGEIRWEALGLKAESRRYPFKIAHSRRECEVDHLTRVYAFTRAHVERANQLARELGFASLQAVGNGEDILLSFSGTGRPRIHDTGAILGCLSHAEEGVATWTSGGEAFFEYRAELHRKLAGLRGIGE
jgi:hypothetical protein